MIIGPKYKICKRLGGAVFEKCQTQKFAISEARSSTVKTGKKRRGGQMSDFKRQLLEKQKMRFSYGISEKQLSRYVGEAMEEGTSPVQSLMRRLEMRLDNAAYRMGIAKTRRLGRQIVSHGHLLVNGRRVTVPSFRVSVGDVITIREGSKQSPLFAGLSESHNPASVPAWLSFDAKTLTGKISAIPAIEQIELFDPEQVFEYYSR